MNGYYNFMKFNFIQSTYLLIKVFNFFFYKYKKIIIYNIIFIIYLIIKI